MKKINLLAGETSSSSGSTTISNLGLIQLKPLLDIEPTSETQELYPGDDGVSGYSFIRIKGVDASLNEKTVDASINTQEILPDEGYFGMSKVTVNGVDESIDENIKEENIRKGVNILGVVGEYAPVTSKIEITPSTEEQVKTPEEGVDGFDTVTVNAVTADIDENITADNIKKGVEILGVEGNYGLELYDFNAVEFVRQNLVRYGNYAFPVEVPLPEGYAGFKSVTLYGVSVSDVTFDPSTNIQVRDWGLGGWDVGFNKVTVNPVTASIDENIQPENIKNGVEILGVTGTGEMVTPVDYTVYTNYHLRIKTAGSATATDDTDAEYVDTTVYTYKKPWCAINILDDLDVIGVHYDDQNNITIVDENQDKFKIVAHTDDTLWIYGTDNMDSHSGFYVLIHYKTDNPRVKEFAFANFESNNLGNVSEFGIFKPMTLGYCCFANFNGRRSITSTAKLINIEALALYGYDDISLETQSMNYAACYSSNRVGTWNIRVDNNLDETDYTNVINASGLLTVDLSPVFCIGTSSNASWAALSNTYGTSNCQVIFGGIIRKFANRNQMFDVMNFSDEGGPHECDLDITEIPVHKCAQSLVLNNIGQIINGTRRQTECYTRCLNLFIPLNSGFKFECTFSPEQIRNDATHITNVVMFNSPDNNTFHNGFTSSNEQVLNFYYDETYSIDTFKTTVEAEFTNVTVNFYPMTVICDNLKECKYESGKNYGFVHSGRSRHSIICVP